jgi:dipeptidyl aminopeptidase/acylaminoacyl peptidase
MTNGRLANESRGVGRVDSYSWSNDGKSLAFSSSNGGNWGIYVVRIDGGPPDRLTPEDQNCTDPSWTADGSIVFTSSQGGLHHLAIMEPEGGAETYLTSGGSDDILPSAYYRGGVVAFVSNRTVLAISPAGGLAIESRGKYTVWILNLTDGDLRPAVNDPISQTPGLQVAPQVSPGSRPVWNSGGHLAIVSVTVEGGVQDEDIYAYYRDIPLMAYVGPAAFSVFGDAVVALVAGVHNETGPAWSPDGKSIVYATDEGGTFNLRILKMGSETPKPYG